MEDGIADRPALELRRLIADGELSPVEVTEACLERVERFHDPVNAVVTVNGAALEEARALEERLGRGENPGPLTGLSVGIKDITETADLRTTYGCPLYADNIPREDALVVRRLRAAGAVIVGKTNTPEFAAGGNTFNEVFGVTRNPWNPARSAGGSTGGGAAGLATGMMALAHGTDLGGSLRIPASFCGVAGLRTSPGLVPTWPSEHLWDELQVTGGMGRTAGDVALFLQATAGPSPLCPVRQPAAGRDFVGAVERARAGGLEGVARVAYCPDVAGIGVDPAVEAVCREAVKALEAEGATVEEVDLDLSYAWKPFLAFRGHWMLSHHRKHLDVLDDLGENLAGNIRAGLEVTAEDLGRAEGARTRMWDQFRDLFHRHDFLLTPCMAVPPFPAEENYPERIGDREMETYVDWIAPTFLLSLTGLPVGAVPAGLDPEGLPAGLQVVGPALGEERVLALMAVLEGLRPLGRPPLVTEL